MKVIEKKIKSYEEIKNHRIEVGVWVSKKSEKPFVN